MRVDNAVALANWRIEYCADLDYKGVGMSVQL